MERSNITGSSGCVDKVKLERIVQVQISKCGHWPYLTGWLHEHGFLIKKIEWVFQDRKSGRNNNVPGLQESEERNSELVTKTASRLHDSMKSIAIH